MNTLFNNFKSVALNVGEMLTPILTESKFIELGVLTPEEFVTAGDHLVHHCPTWQWSSAPKDKLKNYLPNDKQYLISRNVPCSRRCKDMEYDSSLEKVIGISDDDGEGWNDTHHFAADLPKVAEIQKKSVQVAPVEVAKECDTVLGIDDEDDELEDPNVYKQGDSDDDEDEETILKTRTYDLNITYDTYYQVPRLWLVGYNEDKGLLTVDEMNEDFSQDHANKTITFETHPFTSLNVASVHPCRHAQVVKKLCTQMAESGKTISVHQYLIIFLKFMAAVIPTIEYDFTQNVDL
uniref:Autophagy-related protein 3 n=1 Tax=Rhabditophanes sp. KR3021 TaxID=114890 RepID=A0AC35TUA7_9BILA